MCDVTISVFEFLKLFPDEDSARMHLEQVRWGNILRCPYCDSAVNQHKQKRGGVSGYYRCYHCKQVYTVRTGTIFERSHVPLDKWLFTVYLVVVARKGISSLQLAKELGVTQKTAWFMLARIREACTNKDALLSGIVEADEAYFGGREANKHESKKTHDGRGAKGKTPVLGIRQRGGNTIGTVVTDTTASTIHALINEHVTSGAMIITDDFRAYCGLGFDHLSVNHSAKQFVDGLAHTNGIESVWAVVKRGFYGTYHHFSVKHMQGYINEFTFRLNQGNVKVHVIDRITQLLAKIFTTKHVTYQNLIG